MKARYIVDVEMKEGYSPMTERRVETAVWDCAPTTGSIRNVSVCLDHCDTELGNDLFAYGELKGGKWKLLDFFNTYKKVANAVKRAKANTLLTFRKEGVFAAFHFSQNTGRWERC